MKGPIPATALNKDWGPFYNTLLKDVVRLVNEHWDSEPAHLIKDLEVAIELEDHKVAAMLAFVARVVIPYVNRSWFLKDTANFQTEIIANFEPIEWIWEKAGCNVYLPAGHHYDKQKTVHITAPTTDEVDWNECNKANEGFSDFGRGSAESTENTVSHRSPDGSKSSDMDANEEESSNNGETGEEASVGDRGEKSSVEGSGDEKSVEDCEKQKAVKDRGNLFNDRWPPWASSSPTSIGFGRISASPPSRQQSDAETQTPRSAYPLGPTNRSPFAWCVQCVERIGQEDQEPCSRSHSYGRCGNCQRLGKECLPVPVPLRGDTTKLLSLSPDRQRAAVAAFAKKAEAYRRVIGKSTKVRKLVVMRSLNRNMFRLVNAVRAASGQPVFPDEEEVWPEVHGGVSDRMEE